MSVSVSIQIKNATLVRKGLQNLKADIPRIGAEQIYQAMARALRLMKQPGKPIHYPVNWDSERQRRAFFASNGFGGGIPYRRTGAYEAGWYIRRNPRTARVQAGYSLLNNWSAAKYVGGSAYGDSQSRIHKGRWQMVRTAIEKETGRLPREIESHIAMVARRSGIGR